MNIENKISDERLSFYATTQPPFGYTGSDINRMARELVSLRAQLAELAKQEPVAWRIGGDGCPEHLSGDKKYAYAYPRRTIEPLFTRAAPPAPFVVKAPDFKVHAQHPTMAAGMRDNDWKEAIKAAGGSVAE